MSQNPAFLRHLYALALIGGATLSMTQLAWAGPKDGEAKKLAESAIYEDYLNLQFDSALEKLNQAATVCEEGCGQSVKATILRDLGVVYFAGKEDRAKALDYFKQAFQADPFIQLDEDLSSDEIKAVFNEARQAVGVPSSSEGAVADPDEPTKAPAATGSHSPPKEQAVDTPVPLYMIAPEDTDAVKLMFKSPGQDKFRSMGLRRYKAGWGGEIDCNAVSKTPGTLEYYFIMYDELGRETGRVGDEFDAFSLPIKSSLSGPGPSLPDQSPPGSCKEVMAADCPPGFPGCQTYEEEEWAKEEEAEVEKPSVWLTFGGSLDFLMVPASSTVCTTDSPYSCYYGDTFRDPNANLLNPDGTPVADANNFTVPQQAGNPRMGFEGSGSIPGGLTLATQRILVGIDYAVLPEVLLGLRLGYAFGGGPKEGEKGANFLPFHAEGRVAYWFGGAHKGAFRPFVQVGGGAAQVDAKVEVEIVDPAFVPSCTQRGLTAAGTGCLVQKVNAWRKAGTVFGTAGLGAMIATGQNAGIVVEGRGMFLFPSPTEGIAISGLVGFTIGL